MAQESRFILTIDSAGAVLNLQRAAVAVDQFASRTEAANSKLATFSSGLGMFRRAVLGVEAVLGGFGLVELIKDLIKVNVEFERVRTAMLAGADSALAANSNFEWLRKTSVQLGIPIQDIGLQFARWAASTKGTILQGQATRDVFYGVAEASQVLGLRGIQVQRVMLALTEMMSKGVVQAKEAQRQFGQDLPGGFKLLAEAATNAGLITGNSVAKFREAIRKGSMDAGTLLMALPAVLQAHFGEAFDKAISSPAITMGQLKATFQNLLYTLGHDGGALNQFTLMMHDLTKSMNEPGNAEFFQHIADSLGALMGVVRTSVDFIAQHIQLMAGLFAGLATATVLIGLKGLFTWMLQLAGAAKGLGLVETVLSALASPFFLIVSAIGVAVGALIMFNGQLLTLGGHTANVFDWVIAGFQVVGEKIAEASQKLLKFTEGLPGIGPVVRTLAGDFDTFTTKLKQIPAGQLNPSTIFTAFNSSFANVLGPAEAQFARFWEAVKKTAEEAWNNITQNITQGFDNFLAGFGSSFSKLPGQLAGVAPNLFKGFMSAASTAVTVIVDLFFAAAETISAAFKLVMTLLGVVVNALLPVAEGVFRILQSIGALGKDVVAPDSAGWSAFGGVLSLVWGIVKTVIIALAEVATFIGGVLGPIFDAFGMAFQGIADIVIGAFRIYETLVPKTGDDIAKGAKTGSDGWVKATDVIVGSILLIIESLGLAIEWVGAWIQAIGDMAGKAQKIAGDISTLANLEGSWDPAKIKAQGEKLAKDLTDPIPRRFEQVAKDSARVFKDVNAGHVGSRSLDAGTTTQSALDDFANQASAAMTHLQDNVKRSLADPGAMRAAGADAGSDYMSGFVNEVGARAQKLTAEEAIVKAARADLLAKQDAAWAAEDAAAKATPPEPKEKKHKRTPEDRAREQIFDIEQNQIPVADALTAQINLNPGGNPMAIKAIEDAQKKFNNVFKWGNFGAAEEGDTKNATDLQIRFAKALVESSIAEQQLARARSANATIAKNNQEVEALKEQVTLTYDLSQSTADLSASMAAQKELRSKGYTDTVAEVEAGVTKLGVAIPKVEQELVSSAKAVDHWVITLAAASAEIKRYHEGMQFSEDLTNFVNSTDLTDTALAKMTATLAVQRQMMAEHKADVFDPRWIDNPMTKSIYDQAIAMQLAGGSAETYLKTIKAIHDTNLAINNPVEAARQKITDTAAGQRQALTAGDQAAAFQRDQSVSAANDMSAVDPDGALQAIASATDRYQKAHELFLQAIRELNDNTNQELMRNSNALGDAWKTSFHDFKLAAEDTGTQLRQTFSDAFTGMTDALTAFVTTGKLSFTALAQSIIADITKIIIKWLILKAIEMIGSFFADGGVMTSSGPAPLPTKKYAGGGIANSAQTAIFGEGSMPEAYVPLPDGRTIPVTLMGTPSGRGSAQGVDYMQLAASIAMGVSSGMSQALPKPSSVGTPSFTPLGGGSTGGGVSLEVHSHVTVSGTPGTGGTQGAAQTAAPADPKFAESLSKKIANEMKAQVIETVRNEMRPGGAFNPIGANRTRF